MSKLIKKYKTDFFQVSNSVFRDKRLSFQELGLLLELLSLPNEWEFSIRGLSSLHKDGKSTIARTLNSLIKYGYLYRPEKGKQTRDKKGLFEKYDYFIYEDPNENPHHFDSNYNIEDLSQNMTMDELIEESSSKDLSQKPIINNRNAEKGTIYITKDINNIQNKSTSTTLSDINSALNKKYDVDGMLVNDRQMNDINDMIQMIATREIKDTTKADLFKFLHKIYNEEKQNFYYERDDEYFLIRNLKGFVKTVFNGKTDKDIEELTFIKEKAEQGSELHQNFIEQHPSLFKKLDYLN